MEEFIDSCRMCLESIGKFVSLDSELDSTTPTTSYLDAYNFCTNLDADLNDSFPNIICEMCAINLTFVFQVLQKAFESDQLLRDAIKNKKLVVIENYSDCEDDQEFIQKDYEEEEEPKHDLNLDLYEENDFVIEEEQNNEDEEEVHDFETEIEESDEKDSLKKELIVKSEDDESQETTTNIEFTCEMCEEGFSALEDLSQHYAMMHDENTECKESPTPPIKDDSEESSCLNTAPTQKPARDPPVKTWCCEICGKFFSTKQKLTYHNLVHTKEKNYACSLCPKRHSTIFRHRDHMKTHANIRNYECEYCKERFFSKSILVCHRRRHTGERPYKCDICGKAFTQASIMKTHAALHTGKTVACDLCPKKFTRPSHLILHQRSHTGERPYMCTMCPNRYSQKSHLDRHLDTHMGVKHTCEVCGKSYTKKSSLNKHKFVHDTNKSFKCDECQLEFATKDRYNRHMKNTHKNSKKEEIEPKDFDIKDKIL
ncbi:zinc finger protein 664-like [Episyrphus balteatus]|uniref:zinc finger protein 664-like n=1 Tax=Episyrphus balteatus TaxID=286459 RepID=UPI002485FB01|nr:zinc finger protein 664-like [Episyrphus balteatus]